MIYKRLLKRLMFCTHIIQFAKISQKSSMIYICTVVQCLMQKCKRITSKLYSRQYCGIIEIYRLRAIDYIFKQPLKRYASSYNIQLSFMRYHTIVIVIVDRICLQRIIVGSMVSSIYLLILSQSQQPSINAIRCSLCQLTSPPKPNIPC